MTCPENQALDDPAVIGVRQLTFKTTYDDDKIALNTMKTIADITNLMKYSEIQKYESVCPKASKMSGLFEF